jgi:hypothetical protein
MKALIPELEITPHIFQKILFIRIIKFLENLHPQPSDSVSGGFVSRTMKKPHPR